MNILIIGVGYVGLVSGTCLAEMGYRVTCLDINEERIRALNQGIIPMYEPGLEEMLKRNVSAGRLHFTTDHAKSIALADVCFIAVATPMSSSGSADISQVEKVAETIGLQIEKYCVIVTKSTVPVGTTHKVAEIIQNQLDKRDLSLSFDVVSNPEFLKEGNAVQDFMKPDRVIIGVNNERSSIIMKKLYAPFMVNHVRFIIMDIKSSELSKYAANAMLATRISFMNQMANLCEELGADINCVRLAIGSDERIGNKFLYAGAGYGGSCLPKDVKALIYQSHEKQCECSVLIAVDEANLRQKKVMSKKLHAYFKSQKMEEKVIGILGLSFKPDTDDMRAAPSLTLIHDLLEDNVNIRLFDPIAMSNAKQIIGEHPLITWCNSELEVADGADALVLLTEWKQFRLLDLEAILQLMKGKAFFDGRNQYDPKEMQRQGFDYFCIGRSGENLHLNEM